MLKQLALFLVATLLIGCSGSSTGLPAAPTALPSTSAAGPGAAPGPATGPAPPTPTPFGVWPISEAYASLQIGDVINDRVTESDPITAKLAQDRRRFHVLATTDDLTGLHNLRSFENELARLVRSSRTARTPLAIVVLDVDDLKSINDAHGHLAGAEAVRTIGHIIAEQIPDEASPVAMAETSSWSLFRAVPSPQSTIWPMTSARRSSRRRQFSLVCRIPFGRYRSASAWSVN